MMMGWHGGMGPLGWFEMGAFWFVLLGLTVLLVSWLLPGSRDASAEPGKDSAQEDPAGSSTGNTQPQVRR